MRLVQQPTLQWVNSTKNVPVAQGFMYFGVVGQDPKIPENQITVFRKNQLNEYVEVQQPISLSDSGVPIYLGQEMTLYVEEDCAIRVDDRNGAEQYLIRQYFGEQNNGSVSVNGIKALGLISSPVTEIQYDVIGYYEDTTVGGGGFVWEATRPYSDHNGGTVIAPPAIAVWDGTQADIASILNWIPTGGVGCWVRASELNDVAGYGATGSSPSYDVLSLIKAAFAGTVNINNMYITITNQITISSSVDIISPNFDGGLIMNFEPAEASQLINLTSGKVRFYGVDFLCTANNFDFNSWFYVNGSTYLSFTNCTGSSTSDFDPRLMQFNDANVDHVSVSACDFKNINQIWRSNGSEATVKSISILGNEWSDTYGILSLNSPFGFSENTIFSNNTVKNVTDVIQSDGGDYINISDNVFDNCDRVYHAEQMAKRVTITGNVGTDVNEFFVKGWSESGNFIISNNSVTGKIYRYKFNNLTTSVIPWDISLYGNIRASAIGPENSGVQQFPMTLGVDYTITGNSINITNATYQTNYAILVEQEDRSEAAIIIDGFDGFLAGLQGSTIVNNVFECFIDAVVVGISTFKHEIDGNTAVNCTNFYNFYDANDDGRRFSVYGTNTLKGVTQAVRGNQQAVIDGGFIFDGFGIPNLGSITGEDLVITNGYSFKLNYISAAAGNNQIEAMSTLPEIFNGVASVAVKSVPSDSVKAFSYVTANLNIINGEASYIRITDLVTGDLRRRLELPVFSISSSKLYYTSYVNTAGKLLSYEFKFNGEIYIRNAAGALSSKYSGDGITEKFNLLFNEALPDGVNNISVESPSSIAANVTLTLPNPKAGKSVILFAGSTSFFVFATVKSGGQLINYNGSTYSTLSANQNKGYIEMVGISDTEWAVKSAFPTWV